MQYVLSPDGTEQERIALARELATTPETYHALSELFASAPRRRNIRTDDDDDDELHGDDEHGRGHGGDDNADPQAAPHHHHTHPHHHGAAAHADGIEFVNIQRSGSRGSGSSPPSPSDDARSASDFAIDKDIRRYLAQAKSKRELDRDQS